MKFQSVAECESHLKDPKGSFGFFYDPHSQNDQKWIARIKESGFLVYKIDLSLSGNPAQIVEVIAKHLHFPGYYGLNWDSLIDCLSDLKWFVSDKICLLFDGPFLASKTGKNTETDNGFHETLEIILNRWNRTDLTHEKRVLIGLPEPI